MPIERHRMLFLLAPRALEAPSKSSCIGGALLLLGRVFSWMNCFKACERLITFSLEPEYIQALFIPSLIAKQDMIVQIRQI